MNESMGANEQNPAWGPMPMTAQRFEEFKRNPGDESYGNLIDALAVEALMLGRFARFPMTEEKIARLRAGNGRFSPFVVYNADRMPFVVLLVGDTPRMGPIPTAIEMKAGPILEGVVQTPKIAGVAINPWDEGGVMIPTRDLMAVIRRRQEEAAAAKN